jgi:hypothetical protein
MNASVVEVGEEEEEVVAVVAVVAVVVVVVEYEVIGNTLVAMTEAILPGEFHSKLSNAASIAKFANSAATYKAAAQVFELNSNTLAPTSFS